MSEKLKAEKIYTLSFSGTCHYCGNATLIHIKESNIKTCAFCHRQVTEENMTTHHSGNELNQPNPQSAEFENESTLIAN